MILTRKYFSDKKKEDNKNSKAKSIAAGSIAGGLASAGTLYALGKDEIKDLIKNHKRNNKTIKKMKGDVNEIYKNQMNKIKFVSGRLKDMAQGDLLFRNGNVAEYAGKIKTIKNVENQAKKTARSIRKDSLKQINQVNRGYQKDINKKFLKKLGWKKGAATAVIGTGVGLGVGQLVKHLNKKND